MDLLINLVLNYKQQYSEGISTTSHVYQAALLAHKAGASRFVVLSAMFHDIGHIFCQDDTNGCGASNHASVGARVLRFFGIDEKVCDLVEQHANAKRYLVATDKKYADKLSPASRITLAAQGGPMDKLEQRKFEKHKLFKEIIALRRFDDAAKNVISEPTREDIMALVYKSKL